MKQLIACCGLDCESCDARIATVENDNELKEKTARKWSVMNNAPEITAATINCMGCRADGAKSESAYKRKDSTLVVTVWNWILAR